MPTDETYVPQGMHLIPGALSEIAEDSGYFFAEDDERIGAYRTFSNDPSAGAQATLSVQTIAVANKKDGARNALINRLKGLIKGVPV